MRKINLILKLLLLVVFGLFFTIIGINKKTIDSLNNQEELENNINTLRGVIWSNYTFITVSLSIALTVIISKRYYHKYKWTIIFSIFFILLNTGLTVFEELTIKDYKKIDKIKLNNVYIVTSVMNIIYFILFVRLIKICDDILEPSESLYNSSEVNEYLKNGPYRKKIRQVYVPYQDENDIENSYFEGYYGNNYEKYN